MAREGIEQATRNTQYAARIFLLNPPAQPGTAPNREGAGGLGAVSEEGGFVYPPHILATCAAVLREAGWEVAACDGVAARLSVGDLLGRLADLQPQMVGLLASPLTLQGDLTCLRELERAYPQARYLLFGPGLPVVADSLPGDLPATVLLGEPEGLLPAACARLTNCRGEAFGSSCTPDGRAQCLPNASPLHLWSAASLGLGDAMPEGLVQDLDSLPFPAWDLLDAARYPFLTVQASRGCGDSCLYCPYVVAQGRKFRGRSTENVLAELRWLRKSFRPRRIVFRDPVFACERARVETLCYGIVADPALRPGSGDRAWWWECESRPEHLDRELLRLMARAGCRSLKIGLETVDPDLLCTVARTQRPSAAAQYRSRAADLVDDCRRAGIACRLFVLVGLPGETRQAVEETARFLREVRPAGVQVKKLVLYPGVTWPRELALPPAEEVETHYRLLQEAAREAAEGGRPRRSWLRWLLRSVIREA